MEVNNIINEVKKDGYSIFKLSTKTIESLSKIDLSHLEDGFYQNKTEHCTAISGMADISKIISSIQEECISAKIPWNTINIIRVVKHKSHEKYRTHYDSHLYTLVIPLKNPDQNEALRGQLYLVPNSRKQPKFDFINLLQKVFAFRWRGELGYKKLNALNKIKLFDLQYGEAILFNGSRSLHGNLANESEATRITLITHMADPFPNGIGAFMRKVRKVTGLRR